jgi:hypothetical protein
MKKRLLVPTESCHIRGNGLAPKGCSFSLGHPPVENWPFKASYLFKFNYLRSLTAFKEGSPSTHVEFSGFALLYLIILTRQDNSHSPDEGFSF